MLAYSARQLFIPVHIKESKTLTIGCTPLWWSLSVSVVVCSVQPRTTDFIQSLDLAPSDPDSQIICSILDGPITRGAWYARLSPELSQI